MIYKRSLTCFNMWNESREIIEFDKFDSKSYLTMTNLDELHEKSPETAFN